MSWTDAMWTALLPKRDALVKAQANKAFTWTGDMQDCYRRYDRALDYLSRRCIRGEGWTDA